jgi:hypothetical protein
MRKGVSVIGRKAVFGVVSLAAGATALLVLATDVSAAAVGVAGLLGLVVLAFTLYVGAWARNALAWRRERPVAPRAPEAKPGVGFELGS